MKEFASRDGSLIRAYYQYFIYTCPISKEIFYCMYDKDIF